MNLGVGYLVARTTSQYILVFLFYQWEAYYYVSYISVVRFFLVLLPG